VTEAIFLTLSSNNSLRVHPAPGLILLYSQGAVVKQLLIVTLFLQMLFFLIAPVASEVGSKISIP
jgi:hypothetical protein